MRLVFTADPGRAFVVGLSDVGDRFRLDGATKWRSSSRTSRCPSFPLRAQYGNPPPTWPRRLKVWLLAGAPHHTVLSSAVGMEALVDFATIAQTELLIIDSSTTIAQLSKEIRWNQAYYRLASGL